MKKIFAVLAIGFISFGANAQKGKVLVYGNLSLSSSTDAGKNKSNSFDLMPGVGYQFNNNWTAGLGFDLASNSVKTDAGTELGKGSTFAVGPFLRYTKSLSSTFSVFGQLDAMFGSRKSSIGAGAETKTNMMNIGVTPAVSVNVSKKMALNFSFGGLSYASSKVDATGANTVSDFDITFGRSTNIGVQWLF